MVSVPGKGKGPSFTEDDDKFDLANHGMLGDAPVTRAWGSVVVRRSTRWRRHSPVSEADGRGARGNGFQCVSKQRMRERIPAKGRAREVSALHANPAYRLP
jgi:hypothetical protein